MSPTKRRTLSFDEVIHTCLLAIFSRDILKSSLYLKGGQALRMAQDIRQRFSSDLDFSVEEALTDSFFLILQDALLDEFLGLDLHLFEFSNIRRPKQRTDGTPDFWSGWAVSFKLIEFENRNLSSDDKRRSALIPIGSNSSRIQIDISEYEYCNGSEALILKTGASGYVYSRAALLIEKARAICQQHPNYEFRSQTNRSRDFFDIERLWSKSISEQEDGQLIKDCAKLLAPIFAAKAVPLLLLKNIFEESFLENQRRDWRSVQLTVQNARDLQGFDYYVETLRSIVDQIEVASQALPHS